MRPVTSSSLRPVARDPLERLGGGLGDAVGVGDGPVVVGGERRGRSSGDAALFTVPRGAAIVGWLGDGLDTGRRRAPPPEPSPFARGGSIRTASRSGTRSTSRTRRWCGPSTRRASGARGRAPDPGRAIARARSGSAGSRGSPRRGRRRRRAGTRRPVCPVADQLAAAAHVGGDHRRADRQRLRDDLRGRLRADRGQHEHVEGRHHLGDVAAEAGHAARP